jgi:hypothetical protein
MASVAKMSPPSGGSDQTDESVGEGNELCLDDLFEILKNQRRRRVVEYLKQHDGTVSLSELAEHVAAIEEDTTVEALTSQQRKRVYVGLYQCHLPKMDDKGIISYDKDRGTIDPGPNLPLLNPYLAVEESGGTDWHRYYLGCVTAGWILLGANALGAGAYGLTTDLILPLVLLPVTGIAAIQTFPGHAPSL